MRIFLSPLGVFGAADLETGDVHVSNRLSIKQMVNTLAHEVSHLIVGTPNHDDRWFIIAKTILPSFIFEYNIGNINIGNFALNIGNVSGIQNMLLDYHLLLHYRKWSQRVLGTEGRWDFVSHSKIRLTPNPKGTFPVIVEYYPKVTEFQSPIARKLAMDAMTAETKIMLGYARRKFGSFPSPDGGTIQLDGDRLVQEGLDEKEKTQQKAILHGEPIMIHIA
ncbi:MAG: hypothetical protein Q8K86_08210 [Candidatus Nanopelagicaceae bacterium]|nr:hypothetical protein [Candidatus Nanopelagicaceae bacterium]